MTARNQTEKEIVEYLHSNEQQLPETRGGTDYIGSVAATLEAWKGRPASDFRREREDVPIGPAWVEPEPEVDGQTENARADYYMDAFASMFPETAETAEADKQKFFSIVAAIQNAPPSTLLEQAQSRIANYKELGYSSAEEMCLPHSVQGYLDLFRPRQSKKVGS